MTTAAHALVLLNLSAGVAYASKVKVRKRRRSSVKAGSRKGCMTRKRRRKRVHQVYSELGCHLFRRAYRMNIETFFELFQKIKRKLFRILSYMPERQYAPNGRIHPTVFLACAIRIFSGAQPVDVACTYGVSITEVNYSVNHIIDAVNESDELAISFPSSHQCQREIAEGFKRKSQAGIDACAGAIDGLLVWIEKPTEEQCKEAGVGSAKFFCGRKKKYGFNLQATCNYRNQFTNISMMFPGATSDFLAFEASSFRRQLEETGFLAPGLCLFGDNAYVNRSYIATPFQNIPVNDPKDHYNFYHSQLRITIECTFGIFVYRWGILRKPLSSRFGMKKIVLLVECLCRLHNYLIDVRREPQATHLPYTAEDRLQLQLDGAFEMDNNALDELGGRRALIPGQLLHGGEHFDDDPDRVQRRAIQGNYFQINLPRQIIFDDIQEQDLRRPNRRTY